MFTSNDLQLNNPAYTPRVFGFFEDFVHQPVGHLIDGTGATASATAIANLADGTTYATDFAALEANLATLTAKLNHVASSTYLRWTGITSGTMATNAASGGWARISGAATTDDSGGQLQSAGIFPCTAAKKIFFKARAQLGESTSTNAATESDIFLGLLPVDTSIVASVPTDGIYFLKADGGTTLKCQIRVNNATPTYTFSYGTAFDKSVHTYGIATEPDGSSNGWTVRFYLDGTEICKATNQALPATTVYLAASVAWQTGDNTGTKYFDLDYIGAIQER